MSYGPFEISPKGTEECIFSLTVSDEAVTEDASLVYSNKDEVEPGFLSIEVYKAVGVHRFDLTQPGSCQTNARLVIDDAFSNAVISINYAMHTIIIRTYPGMAQAVAFGFFAESLEDYKKALDRYFKFVDGAGTKTFEELVTTAGLPIPYQKGNLKKTVQVVKEWLKTQEK